MRTSGQRFEKARVLPGLLGACGVVAVAYTCAPFGEKGGLLLEDPAEQEATAHQRDAQAQG